MHKVWLTAWIGVSAPGGEGTAAVGEKSAEEAGFPEYAEEIRTAYGIYPLVKEELDSIDPPKPVNSHSSYDR